MFGLLWEAQVTQAAIDDKENEELEAFECKTWRDVRLYTSPWVSGVRTKKSIGFHEFEITTSCLEEGLVLSEEGLAQAAFYSGANAVVGWERYLYLYEDPIRITSGGTLLSVGPL